MRAEFIETEQKEQNNEAANKADAKYECCGYLIRVHFSGEKTLAQCVKNLIERKIGF